MKRSMSAMLLVLLFMAVMFVPKRCLAGAKNSINIGGAYWEGFSGLLNSDPSGSLFFLEYERLLGNSRTALFGSINMSDYKKQTTSGWWGGPCEDGKINGVDIGFRFYPIGGGNMKKLFLGGSIGFLHNEWTYEVDYTLSYGADYTPIREKAKGDSDAIRTDIEIGYRFNLGSEKVSLMPAIHLGHYFVSDKSTKYTYPPEIAGDRFYEDNDLDYYGSFALSLGIAF